MLVRMHVTAAHLPCDDLLPPVIALQPRTCTTYSAAREACTAPCERDALHLNCSTASTPIMHTAELHPAERHRASMSTLHHYVAGRKLHTAVRGANQSEKVRVQSMNSAPKRTHQQTNANLYRYIHFPTAVLGDHARKHAHAAASCIRSLSSQRGAERLRTTPGGYRACMQHIESCITA